MRRRCVAATDPPRLPGPAPLALAFRTNCAPRPYSGPPNDQSSHRGSARSERTFLPCADGTAALPLQLPEREPIARLRPVETHRRPDTEESLWRFCARWSARRGTTRGRTVHCPGRCCRLGIAEAGNCDGRVGRRWEG